MELFVIAGKDFTSNIMVPTYAINQNSKYIGWTDGNYKEHRYKTRTNVSGTFTIWFDDADSYFEFLNLIKKQRNNNEYIPNVRLYCNNINEVITADVFLDITPVNNLPYYGKSHDGYQVTIQER